MSDAPRPDGPSTLFRNPIGKPHPELVLMRRRKARLEMVTGGTSIFTGVSFSMLFIAEHGRLTSLVWGLGAGLLVAGLWWLLRRRRPAEIKEPQLLATAQAEERAEALQPDDEESGWDITSLLLAVTVVPVVVLVGVLLACIVPLMVLVGFLVHAGGASNLMVLTTVACIVLANLAVELGVTAPLVKRWGLPED